MRPSPRSKPELSEETVAEVFRRTADDFERSGSKLYAALARAHADDPIVAEIVGEHRPYWEGPLRLFAGVHYLERAGVIQHPWGKLSGILEANRDWLTRFVAEHPVQTNEVQRCWGLLPGFLSAVDERPLDLVELGPSAGLNLFWDRYRYRYGEQAWGSPDAPLELSGDAQGGPPPELFSRRAAVRHRTGIDRRPVDVTTDHGARVLEAFVWADQVDRLERVRRAIEIARADPPRLMEGDYVEVLPGLLAERDLDALTVVFHSASLMYLREEDRALVESALDQEGRRGSLAWVSYEYVASEALGFALEVQTWPGERARLALLHGHGGSLEWIT